MDTGLANLLDAWRLPSLLSAECSVECFASMLPEECMIIRGSPTTVCHGFGFGFDCDAGTSGVFLAKQLLPDPLQALDGRR
jgi:hypothetical protein